ncbi:MAG: RDD family protein [Bacteroidetes bacterium]|nr:RDD family protein [Bacteroidota bacterium]
MSPVSSLLPSLVNAIAPAQEISVVVYSDISPLFTYLLYIFLMEVTLQTTLGKILTRTKVFTPEGYKPTPGQIFKRTILRLMPFEAFTFLTGYNFHDRFSDTIVCRVSKF